MIRITNWSEHFENNRSREVKFMRWVPVPNDLSSYGLRQISQEKDAAAIFGAFILMVEVASVCEPRGDLIRSTGEPYDSASLSMKTGFPKSSFDRAIAVCSRLGWVTSQEGATRCDDVAGKCDKVRLEGKGREGKKTPPTPPIGQVQVEEIWKAYPRREGKKPAVPLIRRAIASVGFDALLERVRAYAACRKVHEGFVLLPKTYFGQERWNDELEDAQPARNEPDPAPNMDGARGSDERRRERIANFRESVAHRDKVGGKSDAEIEAMFQRGEL